MKHLPTPLFFKYFRADLGRETTSNVVAKIDDVMTLLDGIVGMRSIFSFISDSFNRMGFVLKALLEEPKVKWSNGCASHCLNNLALYIYKWRQISKVTKTTLFVSKTVQYVAMVRKILDSMCEERVGNVYAMVLYLTSIWKSVNYMFRRLIKLLPVFTYMNLVLRNEIDSRNIYTSFELPENIESIISEREFWKGITIAS